MDHRTALRIAQQIMNDPSDYQDGIIEIYTKAEQFDYNEAGGYGTLCIICDRQDTECYKSRSHSKEAQANTARRAAYKRISSIINSQFPVTV